ncbi:MAG: PLDc N-terminal domain-containing protein, partial [Flavobacteriales bacterium]|nr:PLDc N-terminal domain-containing protein [Flavobacteriales bacterium]
GMTRTAKIFLGIITLLPYVLLVLYVLSFFQGVINISSQAPTEDASPSVFLLSMGLSAVTLLLFVLLSIGLFIFYIVDVLNNKRLDKNQRLIWIFVLITTSHLGNLIYWFFQIWREEDDRLEHDYSN